MTVAAAPLMAPEPVHDRRRDRLAGDREVFDCLRGLAAVELLLGPWPEPNGQNARELPGDPDGVVVGDQVAGAGQDAQLGVGQQVERLLGDRERVVAVLVGPQQQHRQRRAAGRRRAARGARRAAASRAQRAHERARFALPPTSAKAWRIRSRAAGLPRAVSPSPRSGRNASWRRVRRRGRGPGTPGRARRARHAPCAPLRAPARGAGGWASARGARRQPRRSSPRAAGSRRPARARRRAAAARTSAQNAGHHLGEPVERVRVARPVLGVAVQRQVGQHDAEAVGEVLDDRLELAVGEQRASAGARAPARSRPRGRRRARRRGGGRGAASSAVARPRRAAAAAAGSAPARRRASRAATRSTRRASSACTPLERSAPARTAPTR